MYAVPAELPSCDTRGLAEHVAGSSLVNSASQLF
jgi:hypothetical protein